MGSSLNCIFDRSLLGEEFPYIGDVLGLVNWVGYASKPIFILLFIELRTPSCGCVDFTSNMTSASYTIVNGVCLVVESGWYDTNIVFHEVFWPIVL